MPLTSPHAAGHSLYVVPLVVWPFLLLLTIGSGYTLLRTHRRTTPLSRAHWIALGALQALLLTVFVLGSIPILTFNLAPDQSIRATAIQTPLGIIAVAALIVEWVLLPRRSTSAADLIRCADGPADVSSHPPARETAAPLLLTRTHTTRVVPIELAARAC